MKSPRHVQTLHVPSKGVFEFSGLLHLPFPSPEFALRLPDLRQTTDVGREGVFD